MPAVIAVSTVARPDGTYTVTTYKPQRNRRTAQMMRAHRGKTSGLHGKLDPARRPASL